MAAGRNSSGRSAPSTDLSVCFREVANPLLDQRLQSDRSERWRAADQSPGDSERSLDQASVHASSVRRTSSNFTSTCRRRLS